jgi:hypothetical protein
MINRIILWFVLCVPACCEVRDGMIDGADGILPRSRGYYYQSGYRVGMELRADRS